MNNHLTAATHSTLFSDWMLLALEQAERALDKGEAPIGSVLLREDGSVLAAAHNSMVSTGNLTAHAEMNAFAASAGKVSPDEKTIMVSTLEPCVMCTGAAMQSGVGTIVYGLQAPADAGTTRVTPPSSPDATMPVIIGDVMAEYSRKLFVDWMEKHEGDESRNAQRRFVSQLLTLTAN